MSNLPISSIEAHFEPLPDPRRVDCRTPHKLLDIIVITYSPHLFWGFTEFIEIL